MAGPVEALVQGLPESAEARPMAESRVARPECPDLTGRSMDGDYALRWSPGSGEMDRSPRHGFSKLSGSCAPRHAGGRRRSSER
jgi:hypothetical protein